MGSLPIISSPQLERDLPEPKMVSLRITSSPQVERDIQELEMLELMDEEKGMLKLIGAIENHLDSLVDEDLEQLKKLHGNKANLLGDTIMALSFSKFKSVKARAGEMKVKYVK
jgi:hypothetical protein